MAWSKEITDTGVLYRVARDGFKNDPLGRKEGFVSLVDNHTTNPRVIRVLLDGKLFIDVPVGSRICFGLDDEGLIDTYYFCKQKSNEPFED